MTALVGTEKLTGLQTGANANATPDQLFQFWLNELAGTYGSPVTIPGNVGVNCGDLVVNINGGSSQVAVGGDFYITTPGAWYLIAPSGISFNSTMFVDSSGDIMDNFGVALLSRQNGRQAAIPDAAGGAIIDTEARDAINALLAASRNLNLIDL